MDEALLSTGWCILFVLIVLTHTWGLSGRYGPNCRLLIGCHTMWPNAGLSLTQYVRGDLNGPSSQSLWIFLPCDVCKNMATTIRKIQSN